MTQYLHFPHQQITLHISLMPHHLINFNYETVYTGVILEGQSAVHHPLRVSCTPNFTQ